MPLSWLGDSPYGEGASSDLQDPYTQTAHEQMPDAPVLHPSQVARSYQGPITHPSQVPTFAPMTISASGSIPWWVWLLLGYAVLKRR